MSASLSISPSTKHDAVKQVKTILKENEVDSVTQILDRLALDKAHATATQIFGVDHSLVQNTRVVMDGEPTRSGLTHILC